MALRWTAAGLLEAQKTFRRLKAYRQLPVLDAALREAVRKAGAKSVIEAGIPHVGTDPRGKACQNRSGLASRLLLTVGVGHVRDRGGWGPWRRPILGSTRHSRRTGPVIGQR